MKTKVIILIFSGILSAFAASAQQIDSDPFPDEQVIAALENLTRATAADTIKTKLTITTKGESVHLGSYISGRNLISANGFGVHIYEEIKKVICFSTSNR